MFESVQATCLDERIDTEQLSSLQMTMWPFLIKNTHVPGRIYGLFVGIDPYPEEVGGTLNCCSADASALHSFFTNYTSSDNLKLLIQTNNPQSPVVTRGEVISALCGFSSRQFKKEDIFLFFFAGHGAIVKKCFNLLASPVLPARKRIIRKDGLETPDVVQACRLSATVLQRYIDRIDAGNQVLVIDACRKNYVSRSPDVGMGTAMYKMEDRLGRPRRITAPGHHQIVRGIISSCWEGKVSWEYLQGGHGWFTYHLLKCLKACPGPSVALATLFTAVEDSIRRHGGDLPQAYNQEPHLSLTGRQIFLPAGRESCAPVAFRIGTFLVLFLTAVRAGCPSHPRSIKIPILEPPRSKVQSGPKPPPPCPQLSPRFASQIAVARKYSGYGSYYEACQKYKTAFGSLPACTLTDSDHETVSETEECGAGGAKDSKAIVEQVDKIAGKLLAKWRQGSAKARNRFKNQGGI